jgi:hypothetical protein
MCLVCGLGFQDGTSLPVHNAKLWNSTARWHATTLGKFRINTFQLNDLITLDGSETKIICALIVSVVTGTHLVLRNDFPVFNVPVELQCQV